MILKFIKRFTNKYYLYGFYRILWSIRRFLRSKDNVYLIHGIVKFKADYNNYDQWMMASTNYFGYEIKQLLSDFLKPGDVFIDVGANVGYFSLFASTIVGEDGMVVAIEPDPRALSTLRINITLNNIKNVSVIEKVCSDKEGVVGFNLASQLGWSTARSNIDALLFTEKIQVNQCTLDNIVFGDLKGRAIKVIKIDVEGYEPCVVGGSKAIIERNETAFIIEINCEFLRSNNKSINDILNEFIGNKFLAFWIDPERKLINRLNKISVKRIVDYNSYYSKNGDIFIVPFSFKC